MIGIYDDTGARLAMAFNSLTLNDDAYPVSSAVINHQYDSVTEPKAQTDGMEAYEARRVVTMLRIDGIVKGSSMADLHDKIDALNTAFDPVLTTLADTADFDIGYLPFTFSVPTTNTDDYPTGLIPMQYFVRSVQLPVARVSKFEGYSSPFTLMLQAVDPRRYASAAEEEVKVGQGSFSIDNSLATYPSYAIVTLDIDKSYASSQKISLIYEDDETIFHRLVLDIQGADVGDVIEVDMAHHTITWNGDDAQELFHLESGEGPWWMVLPGSRDAFIGDDPDNWTGTVTVQWLPAFV